MPKKKHITFLFKKFSNMDCMRNYVSYSKIHTPSIPVYRARFKNLTNEMVSDGISFVICKNIQLMRPFYSKMCLSVH